MQKLIVCFAVLALSAAAHAGLGTLNHLGTHLNTDNNGDPLFDEGLVEIAAYDQARDRLFLTNGEENGLTVLDISDPANPILDAATPFLDLSSFGDGPTSVAVSGDKIAVAVEANTVTSDGKVAFFDAANLAAPATTVTTGPLPDMVTFTPDGNTLLVANEGEALEGSDPLSNNPAGSISFIDTSGATPSFSVTADFTSFDGSLSPGADPTSNVRINPNVSTPSNDIEPEFISVTPDGTKAFVALQENNTLAEVDIAGQTITALHPLGVKDHSLADSGFPGFDGGNSSNGLDANKNDDAIGIQTENLFGMLMPDAIATYEVDGETYIVTANEGDSRDDDFGDFDDLRDEGELGDTIQSGDLDTNFPNPDIVDELDGLEVSQTDGDTDGDGDFDKLFTFGGRSFSILRQEGDGSLTRVFDSGDDFEQIIANQFPNHFNAGDDDIDIDDRSDDAGPEPEGVTLGQIGNNTLAFIGIEKMGGIMVYDVTDPMSPQFLNYLNDRTFNEDLLDAFVDATDGDSFDQADFDAAVALMEDGKFDIAPEGLLFIPAADSPNGQDLLVVANEGSGTTSIYEVVPEPGTVGLLALGGLALIRRRRA